MSLTVKPISANLKKGRQHLFFHIDPYVECIVGNERQKSKADWNAGKEPRWLDTFSFTAGSPLMRVVLYDKDRITRDDMLG
jgi:hypothetical protein